MLHEVLLALSGHPSPLFDQNLEPFPLVTPAEASLLASTCHLAKVHRALKTHLSRISTTHLSVVCRAVANALLSSHLSRFQHAILDVERQILSNDTESVGAYNIVPLAGVVKSFDGWRRKLDWYWEIACYMLPAEAGPTTDVKVDQPSDSCSAAAIISKLRRSSSTGYPDIEDAANSLTIVAERVWMRLLSTWLISGQLSAYGSQDFFIRVPKAQQNEAPTFFIDPIDIPIFVTKETAASILFIGKLLNFFETQPSSGSVFSAHEHSGSQHRPNAQSDAMLMVVQSDHIHQLASITLPIKAADLGATISRIRRSLSCKLSDKLLPIHKLLETMTMLHNFCLFGRSEFTDTLINEADKYLRSRHEQTRVEARQDDVADLAGVMMREPELGTILAHTWTKMSPSLTRGEAFDEELEWGRDHLHLRLLKSSLEGLSSRNASKNLVDSFDTQAPGADIFSDLLLSTAAVLTPQLPPTLNIFFTPTDLKLYSIVHNYLLVIRRGHLHLGNLWKHGPLRKDGIFPTVSIPGRKKSRGPRPSEMKRTRLAARSNNMRKIWASSSSAVFILSELGAYFADEVVTRSWHAFYQWALGRKESSPTIASSSRPLRAMGDTSNSDESSNENLPVDPETLMQAHQLYLATLTEALLLNDGLFSKSLRSLLTHIDHFVAFVERLRQAQQNLDLYDEDPEVVLRNKFTREEEVMYSEAVTASRRVDDDVKRLVNRLKTLSTSRRPSRIPASQVTDFKPWNSTGGAERLLMKLDFRVTDEAGY